MKQEYKLKGVNFNASRSQSSKKVENQVWHYHGLYNTPQNIPCFLYREANAVIIECDLSKSNSVDKVMDWLEMIDDYC